MKNHILPDCFAVWYGPFIDGDDMMEICEEICEQGHADLKFDGINKKEAKKVHNRL